MERSVFFGTPDFAVPIGEATAAVSELVAVVTQPDRPKGRGRAVVAPPVKRWAEARGIPVLQPTRLRDPAFVEALEAFRPAVAVVAAYGRILPRNILELPTHGCLNVHASLLPKYRGAAPIQWAVARGESKTGVTLMQMDEGLDTGDMLAKREIAIEANDTGGSLHDKLAALGATLIREELPRFLAGELEAVPQREEDASLAPILRKEDGRLDFHMDARELDFRVRGFSPWPGAYTFLADGSLLKVHAARPVERPAGSGDAAPGTVLSLRPLLVAAGAGSALELLEVQPEGKRRMQAADLVAGRRVEVGQVLGAEKAR